ELAGAGERLDEEVAGMGVGVHEVVDEDLLHVHAVEDAGDLGAADPRPRQRLEVRDLQIPDVFHRHRPPGAPLPVDLGDADPRIAGEVFGEALGVLPLGGEVELAAGGRAEFFWQPPEIDTAPYP